MDRKYVDAGLLVLRVGAGVLLMGHGLGKVQKILAGDFSFADPIGIGPAASLVLTAFAEFLCAGLVVLGYKVRWASIPVIGAMLIAAFVHHAPDPWGKKEFPLLYALIFITLAITGGGHHSLERWRRERARQAEGRRLQ